MELRKDSGIQKDLREGEARELRERIREVFSADLLAQLKDGFLEGVFARAVIESIPPHVFRSYCSRVSFSLSMEECRKALLRDLKEQLRRERANRREGAVEEALGGVLTLGFVPFVRGLHSALRDVLISPWRQFLFGLHSYFLSLAVSKVKEQRDRLLEFANLLGKHPFVSLETKLALIEDLARRVGRGEIDLTSRPLNLNDHLSPRLVERFVNEVRENFPAQAVREVAGKAGVGLEKIKDKIPRILEKLRSDGFEVIGFWDYEGAFEGLVEPVARSLFAPLPAPPRALPSPPPLLLVEDFQEVREDYERVKDAVPATPLIDGEFEEKLKEKLEKYLDALLEARDEESLWMACKTDPSLREALVEALKEEGLEKEFALRLPEELRREFYLHVPEARPQKPEEAPREGPSPSPGTGFSPAPRPRP